MRFRFKLANRPKQPSSSTINTREEIKSYLVFYNVLKTGKVGRSFVFAENDTSALSKAKKLAFDYGDLISCELVSKYKYDPKTKQYYKKPMSKKL